MANDNYFSRTMLSKSDSELQKIVNSENEYSKDAVNAAKWEIERREELLVEQVKEKLEQASEKKPIPEKNVSIPRIYSEMVLMIFGALFSVFASGILVALNLMEIGRKMQAMFAILFGLAFIVIQGMVLRLFNASVSVFLTIPLSLLGVFLMQKLIWEKEYPKGLPFKNRSPWLPFLIGVVVSVAMAIFIYYKLGMLPGMPNDIAK